MKIIFESLFGTTRRYDVPLEISEIPQVSDFIDVPEFHDILAGSKFALVVTRRTWFPFIGNIVLYVEKVKR